MCLQSNNDVVMTVQLVGLDLLGLWISAMITPMSEKIYVYIYVLEYIDFLT